LFWQPYAYICTGIQYSFTVTGCEVHGRKQDIKSTSEIVDAAMNALKNFPESLKKGIVTEKQLLHYKQRSSELKLLCESFDHSAKLFQAISSGINICFTKVKITKEYRYKLSIVVDYCKPVSNSMWNVIIMEKPYTWACIVAITSVWRNGQYYLLYFFPVIRMLNTFHMVLF